MLKFKEFSDSELFQILDGLSESEKEVLFENVKLQSIPKNRFIFMPGQPADELYLLVKGVVKISNIYSKEKEFIKSILHPGSIFGDSGLYEVRIRPDFATSMNEEVQFYAIPTAVFKDLLRSHARLSQSFINILGNRLMNTENRLELLMRKDSRSRIIDFLKKEVTTKGRRVGFEMFLKSNYTHQDIANVTGTSRQTVTTVLNDLKKLNLIHFNRHGILIRDMDKM